MKAKFYITILFPFLLNTIVLSKTHQKSFKQDNNFNKSLGSGWFLLHNYLLLDMDVHGGEEGSYGAGCGLFFKKGIIRFGLDYHYNHYFKEKDLITTKTNPRYHYESYQTNDLLDIHSSSIKIILPLFFWIGKQPIIGFKDNDFKFMIMEHKKIYFNLFCKQQKYNIHEEYEIDEDYRKVYKLDFAEFKYYHIGFDLHIYLEHFRIWISPSYILNISQFDEYNNERDNSITNSGIPKNRRSHMIKYSSSSAKSFDFQIGVGSVFNYHKISFIMEKEFDDTYYGIQFGLFFVKHK